MVIVTKALAARLFPGRDPIGQRIKVGPPESEPWLRVVGVSGDLSQAGIDAPAEYQTFEPLAQRPRAVMRFALRTGGDPEALARPALVALRALEPAAVLDQLATMDSRIQASLRPRRLQTTLILIFALLSLVITALGVYGVAAATVEQRTREMGLRSALGAGPKEILRFALGQGFVPIGAGLALGLGLSAAMAPALRGLLYGIEPLTPGVHLTAALGLAFIALCASLGPARRALRLSPSEALSQRE